MARGEGWLQMWKGSTHAAVIVILAVVDLVGVPGLEGRLRAHGHGGGSGCSVSAARGGGRSAVPGRWVQVPCVRLRLRMRVVNSMV
jgi:hypothetical protein